MTATITLISNKESVVWGITLSSPIESEFDLRELQDVKFAVATGIKGSPYFEKKKSTYWYLIDKPMVEDELDDLYYIKECVAAYLLVPEVTAEVVEPLKRDGFIDITRLHNSADRILFEKRLQNFDIFNLVYKGLKIPVRITGIQYDKKVNDLQKLSCTLALVG